MAAVTITYAASVSVFTANGLDSLASSLTYVAGQESAVIDNTTNKYVDASLAGFFKANNTAPTAGQIQVWVGAVLNDTPTYPDVFDGTESAETITSADIRNSCLALAAVIITDATANRIYPFKPVSVASLFGHIMPRKWFVFVTHSMVQTLNVTAGAGGTVTYDGIKYDVT